MADRAPTISTHVLDTGRGEPAAGIAITLSRVTEDGIETTLTRATTDANGRVADLVGRPLEAGAYRLRFELDAGGFFTAMTVDLLVADPSRSYHVPLLVAPFGLSTYRGS